MKFPEIVGIGGTNGAGKDTLAALRMQCSHVKTASLSDIIRLELDKQGKPHTRENMRAVSTKWRKEFGADALVVETLKRYRAEKEKQGYEGITITSLRHPGVVKRLKAEDALIVWIDGDRHARFKRIKAAARGRVEDDVSYEEFCQQEDAEMYPPEGDQDALDMNGVKEISDVFIDNNFSTREEYEAYLKTFFELGP